MCRLSAVVLGLALATAASAQDADDFAVATRTAATTEASGAALGTLSVVGEAAAEDGEASWRLCQVSLDLLLSAGGHSEVVRELDRALFHGEVIEFEGEAQAVAGSRLAVVAYQVRLRAAMARPDGVVYHLTSSARLTSTIGFTSELVGRDAVRHVFLDIGDGGTRLHEVFAMPDPPMRLMLGVSADPIRGRTGPEGPTVGPATFENPERFKIELVLREGEFDKLINKAEVIATSGRAAAFAISRLDSQRRTAGDPEHRLGDGVRAVHLGTLPDSGYADSHTLHGRSVGPGLLEESDQSADSGYLAEHRVVIDTEDDPRHYTITAKRRKLSKRKEAELRAQQRVLAAARAAQRAARTLPSDEGVPEGFLREDLRLEITPLHAGLQWMQAEIHLRGAVRLPGDDDVTPVDLRFVEELERGEPYELLLVEVLRGAGAKYDYVFRITPSS